MKNNTLKLIVLFLLLVVGNVCVLAQVSLPPLFSDNMVLQQQSDAPIWGKATPNKVVKVITSWNKIEYTTIADQSGKWMIKVSTPLAGGPYEVTIVSGKTIRLKNVLIGEVWICSGQSNMEMPMAGWGQVYNFEKEIAEANHPKIRLLQVERNVSFTPLTDLKVAGGRWQECSPASVTLFSSTAYFFGRSLSQNLKVPIGLIHTSWGGTVAEAWTSAGSLETMPSFASAISEIKVIPKDEIQKKEFVQEKKIELEAKINQNDFAFQNGIPVVTSLDYNDGGWQTINTPGHWEQSIYPSFDGFVWFRKIIDIPAAWQGKQLTLSLSRIDDNEITYFNGTLVGRTDGALEERVYTIPSHLVKSGKAVISLRVMDTGGYGGFTGSAEKMFIMPRKGNASSKIRLSGEWKSRQSFDLKDMPTTPRFFAENPNHPTSLFNAMLNPIIPYKIKGAIWYQGESNEKRAYQYRDLFPLMINDWRKHWGDDFPFYFVQLANYQQRDSEPKESNWAELREAQTMALSLANTGMAVSIDIGNADDIHPKNKQDVGARLALAALAKTYNKKIEYSGPLYDSYKIEGNKIRISFLHVQSGLKTKGVKTPMGFSIAGVDHKFHWAEAIIDGNDILVSSPKVPFPVAVRYGWATNPNCNLYNGADLPASPFRTDDWQGITYGVE